MALTRYMVEGVQFLHLEHGTDPRHPGCVLSIDSPDGRSILTIERDAGLPWSYSHDEIFEEGTLFDRGLAQHPTDGEVAPRHLLVLPEEDLCW